MTHFNCFLYLHFPFNVKHPSELAVPIIYMLLWSEYNYRDEHCYERCYDIKMVKQRRPNVMYFRCKFSEI